MSDFTLKPQTAKVLSIGKNRRFRLPVRTPAFDFAQFEELTAAFLTLDISNRSFKRLLF